MPCDNCEMVCINGINCHEIGCSRAHKQKDVETDGERFDLEFEYQNMVTYDIQESKENSIEIEF